VSYEDARQACLQVEKLLTARTLNQPIDPQTTLWLAGLADGIHSKLARAGLCPPRVPVPAAPAIGEYLAKHIAQRSADLKPGSIARLKDT
jgi:hypothetical protein